MSTGLPRLLVLRSEYPTDCEIVEEVCGTVVVRDTVADTTLAVIIEPGIPVNYEWRFHDSRNLANDHPLQYDPEQDHAGLGEEDFYQDCVNRGYLHPRQVEEFKKRRRNR